MTELSIKEFTNALASKEPVPGGGGAAALVGALGIALGSMVGEFTLGKKKYADVEEEIKDLIVAANNIKTELLIQIKKDAEAFEPLSKAYAIPKDNPARDSILENATKDAINTPFKMITLCAKAIEILRIFQLKGSVMLISDAGCGAAFCKAAMQAAAMNVFINTKILKDKEYANNINIQVDKLMKESIPLADSIIEEVSKGLRG